MKNLLLGCALVVAACGGGNGDDRDGGNDNTDSDGPDGASAVTELGRVGVPGRLALAGDCAVIAGFGGVVCIPLAGGAPRTLAPFADRLFGPPVADGTGIVVATLASDFGPSGDRTMHIDRIGLDGSATTLGTAFAGYGAGEGLAIAGDRVVFSTGGSADLYAIPRAGGAAKLLASDSGNFGDVAVIGTTAYYVNGFSVYAHDLASTASSHGTSYGSTGSIDAATLATDGTSLVAVGAPITDSTQTLVQPVPAAAATTIPPLPGAPGGVAMADGRAYVVAGGNVYVVDVAAATATVLFDGPAQDDDVVDLAIDGDRLVWVQLDGKVRARAR